VTWCFLPLSRQPRRHGELVEAIGGVSRKVLTQTLRRLQHYGLVEREQVAARHVEYRLTGLGGTLVEPIEALTAWARTHGEAIVSSRKPPWRGADHGDRSLASPASWRRSR
jgi:DNA-binding HxlR family transcriptional regulator